MNKINRFMKYVDKGDFCWTWTGGKYYNGYGQFYANVVQWADGLDTVDNSDNLLTTLYKDGRFYKETNLSEIRQRVQEVL